MQETGNRPSPPDITFFLISKFDLVAKIVKSDNEIRKFYY